TPSPTPKSTPSPTPKPTPSATPEPTPSPTPKSTPSPTPKPTPSPTPEPTPSPTPKPTPSPTPEPTPSPTPKPTPSPTPEPTPSPTPKPTPSPTPQPSQSSAMKPTNITVVSMPAKVDFAFYVLSQTWQPSFCKTSNFPGCANPTDYMKSHFTIHGLWPNYINNFPADCTNQVLSDDDVKSASEFADVKTYWPDVKTGGIQFVKNEWSKHGTCSGLTAPADYVKATMATHLYMPTNAIISGNLGSSVHAKDIRAAYGTDYVSLICKGADLSEVRTCYSTDLKYQIPCPAYVLGQDSCGSKTVKINSFK
ncbi:hypothetical protein As57867_017938, partial [Aphanomyces stellatus]